VEALVSDSHLSSALESDSHVAIEPGHNHTTYCNRDLQESFELSLKTSGKLLDVDG
jgi:hypothetical protein